MKQTGIVISIEGEYAKVECDRQSACDMCENSSGCTEKCKKVYATAKNTEGAVVGNKVEIETETADVLKNAFIVFFLPVVLAVLSYFLTDILVGSTFAVILVTLIVLSASLVLFAKILDKKAKAKDLSRIVRIIE